MRAEQGKDPGVEEMLAGRRCPWHEAHTVKTDEARVGTNPQVAVERLGKHGRRAVEIAVCQAPCCMAVLRDLSRGIEGLEGRRGCQGNGQDGHHRQERSHRLRSLSAS
jgi:hypothetical protein